MQAFSHLHHLPHHRLKNMSIFYLAATLRTFVFSFLYLFIPALLYRKFLQMGYLNQEAIILTAFSFIIFYIAHLIFPIGVGRLIYRRGIRTAFVIGQLLLLPFFILLSRADSLGLIFLSFFLFGTAASFWWTSYHTYFMELGKRDRLGRELGTITIMGILLSASAPFMGGILLTAFGSNYLYYFSFFLIFISVIMLYFIEDLENLDDFTFKDILAETGRSRRDFIAFLGGGGESFIHIVVWPLILALIIGDFIELGGFLTLITLITTVFIYIVGRLADRNKQRLERIGTIAVALVWTGKALTVNLYLLFIFGILFSFFSYIYHLPMDTIMYSHGLRDKKLTYVVFREMSYKVGSIISGALFIILIKLGVSLSLTLLIAAVSTLSALYMREKSAS